MAPKIDVEALRQTIQQQSDVIVDAAIPSVVPLLNFLVLTRDGEVLYKRTAGTRQLGSLEPLEFNDIFWLASHTKILAAMSMLKCIDMGLIGLDDSVTTLLPSLGEGQVRTDPNDPKSPTRPRVGDITVRNLLALTAGNAYPVIEILASLDPMEIAQGKEPFFPTDATMYEGSHATDPNTVWRYGAEIDYLGLLVEKLSGMSLEEFIQTHILAPSGVKASEFTFKLNDEQRARTVGQHVRISDTMVIPRAPIYNDAAAKFQSAGAGGFGTIDALGQALLPIINEGKHPKSGKQILSSSIVKKMLEPQLSEDELENGLNQPSQAERGQGVLFPGVAKQWGLGALLFPEGLTETGRGKGTSAWAGFTNVNWHCDNEKGLVILAWSQLIPQDDPNFINHIRYPIEKIIYDAVGTNYF